MTVDNILNPSIDEFQDTIAEYEETELRSIFYNLAVEKQRDERVKRTKIEDELDQNLLLPIQIILLSWNARAYLGRDVSKQQFDEGLTAFLRGNKDRILRLQNVNLLDVDFLDGKTLTNAGEDVVALFDNLVGTNGKDGVTRVRSTGASKLLHFVNRDLFVMWDGYISGKLQVENSDETQVRVGYHRKSRDHHWREHTAGDGECYVTFLDEMQSLAEALGETVGSRAALVGFGGEKKTIPKLLDEYNYQKITVPYT